MLLHQVAFVLALVTLGNAYSKFGRTCKDIGCLDNEVCVMESKPCGYYDAQNECGQYPTCKKTTDTSAIPSCTGYVCPPSKTCQMDGATPKCVDDLGASGVVPLTGQSGQPGYPYNPSAPSAPSSGLYPSVPVRGQTTTRPPNYRPGGYAGSGYQGGAPGSGYPGQQQPYTPPPHGAYPGAGYPGSGYPGQSGYPSQGGYPSGQGQYGRSGYPGQSGYPQYPQSGNRYPSGSGSSSYPGGYQTNQYGQRYGYNSGNSFVDKITNQLKTIGLFCLILSYFTQNLYGV